MPGLYLSAAHRDQPLADRLRAAFARREVPCAADDHRMGDRAALPPAIITALDDAAGLVVLASPAGCASAQVAAEVQHVTDRGQPAVPCAQSPRFSDVHGSGNQLASSTELRSDRMTRMMGCRGHRATLE